MWNSAGSPAILTSKATRADAAAVRAATCPEELVLLYYKDYYPSIQAAIDEERNIQWRTKNQKMHEIKPTVEYWPVVGDIPRQREVIINRLRAGHCKLTHGYLMNNEIAEPPPECEWCHNATLTVKHLLIVSWTGPV